MGFRSTPPPGYKGPPYIGHSCRAAVFSAGSEDSSCGTPADRRLAASGILIVVAMTTGVPPLVRSIRRPKGRPFEFDSAAPKAQI